MFMKLAPLRDFLYLYKIGKELLLWFIGFKLLAMILSILALVLLLKYSNYIPDNPKFERSNGAFPVDKLK